MSAHEPIGHGLNPAQKEAVLYLDGPCLVLAGAGSGKTRVITQKIAYLLRECGYMGRNVVALTFTNKAAREMDERVKTLVDRKLGKGLTISTFHSLGVKLLREEARNAGLKPTFSILDADDAMAIIQELLATTDKGRLRHVQGIISLWKNALMEPDDAAREAITPGDVEAANVYRSYAATLAAYQAVDFDDLIRIPALLLANNEEVRTRWQNRVRYLLVDEYQDTNVCQYRLVQLLTGPRAMFTAVGDDDQAIYAWRGATIENLAKLTTDYPNLKLIKLEQNYRSVQRILAAANQVIEKNPKLFDKKLWSDLGVGEPILVSPMDGEEHEAESIAMKVSAARFERQAQWKDFAILYRGNHQARILEQALRNLKIPYTISGGQSFFDKAEVRDILAYLRLLANDEDDPAFIRAATTPKRGIGQATLQTLGQYAASRELSLLAAVDETGLESLLAPRQLEPLRTFTEFIRRMQWRAGRARRRDPGRPGAGDPVRTPPVRTVRGASGADPLAERAGTNRLAQAQGRRGQHDPVRAGAARGAGDHARARRGRGAGRGQDVDAARVQGPGVSARVPGRGRGRIAAAPGQGRRGWRSGARRREPGHPHPGRAAPDVRRHHPRAAHPEPELVQAPPPGARGPGARAVALHRGNGAGRPDHQGRRDHGRHESQGAHGHAQGLAQEVTPQ